MGYEDVEWINLPQARDIWRVVWIPSVAVDELLAFEGLSSMDFGSSLLAEPACPRTVESF